MGLANDDGVRIGSVQPWDEWSSGSAVTGETHTISNKQMYIASPDSACSALTFAFGSAKQNKHGECMSNCDSNCKDQNELTKDVLALDLELGERLLREYEVVDESGVLTEKGRRLVLNVLFKKGIKTDVVDYLKRLDAYESGEEEGPISKVS